MPELQLDVQVANRFISSLSKSLQALCHGCMDFDSGIEIVGYINVNIDSGSKVDYVLNEKVLKSTTNSMTFVSNSFLAKKDQPKQTRDGSCSPVHELEEQYQAAFRGASMGMHHRKSTSHLPPQSHSFRGSSKRSWSGDFRMSAKRHRLQHPQSESQSFSGHSPQFPQPTFPSPSASQVYTDSSFKHPQPSHATELSSDSQQQISIKKEALDTDDNKLTSNPDTDSSTDQNQPPDESHNSTKEQADNFKIKQDPDAAATTDDQETASENTDIKNTLQDQSSSADSQQPEEGHTDIKSTNEEVPDDQLPTFGEGQNVAAEHDGASTSADMSFPSEGGAFDSDIPIEYDNAAEDGSYSQSTYPDDSVDPGEGSSDANQFEVIEIDDEDEDVQAMFGEPQGNAEMWHPRIESVGTQDSDDSVSLVSVTTASNTASPAHPVVDSGVCDLQTSKSSHEEPALPQAESGSSTNAESSCFSPLKCPHCERRLQANGHLRIHISRCHGHTFQYCCPHCGWGFKTKDAMYRHRRTHNVKYTLCPICEANLSNGPTIQSHLQVVHNSVQCNICLKVFKIGRGFNRHVQTCKSGRRHEIVYKAI